MTQPEPTYSLLGINTDDNLGSLQPGEYPFALNAVVDQDEQGFYFISTERGNVQMRGDEFDNFQLVGYSLTNSDEILMALTNNVVSKLVLYNPISQTSVVVLPNSSDCLNFKTTHPVRILFRITKGCNRTFYLTDYLNSYKVIDIDDQDQYYDSNGDIICKRLELQPKPLLPAVEYTGIIDGAGNLPVGSYQFAIRYLDSNLNPTNWLLISNPIAIFDENSLSYMQYDGAINIYPNAEPEEGAVPLTSKAIELRIDNLDLDFKFYQLAAIHRQSAIGTPSKVLLIEPQLIGEATDIYTYPGESLATSAYSLEEIQVDYTIIDLVKDHAQTNNSLLLANVKTLSYDYSQFQKFASKIKAFWRRKQVSVEDLNNEGDPKNFLTMPYYRTFMGNEIYAFGIRYLIKGQWTPVFHIPGRPINTNIDTCTNELPTGEVMIENAIPRGINAMDGVPNINWAARNTAYRLDPNIGAFGYYQIQNKYPTVTDCAGNSIWGKDFCDTNLDSKAIRHHRFPDRNLIPVFEENKINVLGVEFGNIDYPHPDVEGHQFMYAKRDQLNKTILSKGYIRPIYKQSDNRIHTLQSSSFYVTPGFSTSYFEYANAPHRFNTRLSRGTHLTKEGTFLYKLEPGGGTTPYSICGGGAGNDIQITATVHSLIPSTDDSFFHRLITGNINVERGATQPTTQGFLDPVINRSTSNRHNAIALKDSAPGKIFYVSNRVFRDVYNSLDKLIYLPIHDSPKVLSDSQISFNGDCYISHMRIVDSYQSQEPRNHTAQYVTGMWIEDEINWGARHSGTSEGHDYFKENQKLEDYYKWKITTLNEDGSCRLVLDDALPEFYYYNKDYSALNDIKPGFSLPFNHNYCSKCLNYHPYRIFYSESSNQEESTDSYRIIRANNYRDIDGSSGSITNLIKDKNEIYVQTQKHLLFLATNPQTIDTDLSTIYLGTGSMLAIPPTNFASTLYTYGGSEQILGGVTTEFGSVILSEQAGKIFLLRSSIEEISSMKTRHWFRKNLPLKLRKQFKEEFNVDFELTSSPTHTNGIGFITTYDPVNRRIIVHKRDYLLKPGLTIYHDDPYRTDFIRFSYPPNELYYYNNKFYRVTGNYPKPNHVEEVDITDQQYFENHSWTKSFSFIHKRWISFHSYFPTYAFNTEDNFYLYKQDKLWRHNHDNFIRFFDTNYKHIIELVQTNSVGVDKSLDSLEVHANTYSTTDQLIPDKFFNQMISYSETGSTGLQTLVNLEILPFASVNTSPNICLSRKLKDHWQLSHIRDYSLNSTELFLTSYPNIQNEYFIDKVVNTNNINFFKPMSTSNRLTGKWFVSRLIQTDTSYRLATRLGVTNLTMNIR